MRAALIPFSTKSARIKSVPIIHLISLEINFEGRDICTWGPYYRRSNRVGFSSLCDVRFKRHLTDCLRILEVIFSDIIWSE